jgi:16S rRNA processing protein RimM
MNFTFIKLSFYTDLRLYFNLPQYYYFTSIALHSCTFASLFNIFFITQLQGGFPNPPFGDGGMNYFKTGKLVAVHGLKGELILKHELGKKTSLKNLKAIFIEEKKDSFLPWFIESTKIKSEKEIYLKLEGIETREAATRLSQKDIWFAEEDFKKFAAKTAPASLLGYTIINNNEILSEVLEVIEQPHQLLCRIELKNKEVLIPVNENFLKKIDHKKKEVIVELPEGLIDIYL